MTWSDRTYGKAGSMHLKNTEGSGMNRIFALCALSLANLAQAFDGQPLRYEVDWGPVTLADVEMRLLDSDPVRSVNVSVASRGAGAWFNTFQSELEILDMRDGTQLLNGTSRWDDGFSQISVSWLPDQVEPTVDYVRSKPRTYDIPPFRRNRPGVPSILLHRSSTLASASMRLGAVKVSTVFLTGSGATTS